MTAASRESDSPAVLDIRTYALVPRGRDEFDPIFRDGAFPMLRRAGIQVVGYGPSLADDQHFFLARAFRSVAERDRQLSAFYGSDEWRETHESTVMGLIEAYHVLVVPLAMTTMYEALTATPPSAPGATAWVCGSEEVSQPARPSDSRRARASGSSVCGEHRTVPARIAEAAGGTPQRAL